MLLISQFKRLSPNLVSSWSKVLVIEFSIFRSCPWVIDQSWKNEYIFCVCGKCGKILM